MIICIWNLSGKSVWFESTPRSENGAKSQVMRGLEFIFMNIIHTFKWRSHSPGSMKNMSNKRASALNKVLRVNLAFIIFCYTARIVRLLFFLKSQQKLQLHYDLPFFCWFEWWFLLRPSFIDLHRWQNCIFTILLWTQGRPLLSFNQRTITVSVEWTRLYLSRK